MALNFHFSRNQIQEFLLRFGWFFWRSALALLSLFLAWNLFVVWAGATIFAFLFFTLTRTLADSLTGTSSIQLIKGVPTGWLLGLAKHCFQSFLAEIRNITAAVRGTT